MPHSNLKFSTIRFILIKVAYDFFFFQVNNGNIPKFPNVPPRKPQTLAQDPKFVSFFSAAPSTSSNTRGGPSSRCLTTIQSSGRLQQSTGAQPSQSAGAQPSQSAVSKLSFFKNLKKDKLAPFERRVILVENNGTIPSCKEERKLSIQKRWINDVEFEGSNTFQGEMVRKIKDFKTQCSRFSITVYRVFKGFNAQVLLAYDLQIHSVRTMNCEAFNHRVAATLHQYSG